MPSTHDGSLARVSDKALEEFSAKHAAREQGLRISREVIRLSANAIRAVHRQDFDQARDLVRQAEGRLKESALHPGRVARDLLRGLSLRRQEGVQRGQHNAGAHLRRRRFPSRGRLAWKWRPTSTAWPRSWGS